MDAAAEVVAAAINVTEDSVEVSQAAASSSGVPVFKYFVEGFLVPAISVFGVVGNVLSTYILRTRDVKISPDFAKILVALAVFDNLLLISVFFLFTVPMLSDTYSAEVFPYTVPYLYPLANTFMTCSGYMTVTVGVNRYLELSQLGCCSRSCRNAVLQSWLVLAIAAAVNAPKWFEFTYEHVYVDANGTEVKRLSDAPMGPQYQSMVRPMETALRMDPAYIRDYILISSSVLMVFAPSLCMGVTTLLIYRAMSRALPTQGGALASSGWEQSRRRRNRAVTLMLIKIMLVFIVCHVGEVFLSLYEMLNSGLLAGGGGSDDDEEEEEAHEEFPEWIKNIITLNHLLLVANSSMNFIIYCGDIVFRHWFMTICWPRFKDNGLVTIVGETRATVAQFQLQSLRNDHGIALEGDPSPEVILRDLDPQSRILCGLENSVASAYNSAGTVSEGGGGGCGGLQPQVQQQQHPPQHFLSVQNQRVIMLAKSCTSISAV